MGVGTLASPATSTRKGIVSNSFFPPAPKMNVKIESFPWKFIIYEKTIKQFR